MDNSISPLPSFITTILGQAGAWIAAALVAKGVATHAQDTVIIGAVVGLGTFAWRLVSSYIKTHNLNKAIAAPSGSAG